MKKYSKINKISNSTIRRYFLPPKKNIQSSEFYKSHILAKIPQKRNSKSIKEHCDFHFTCALVNYVEELSSLYNDEILALSCDNKAKIPLAVLSNQRKRSSSIDSHPSCELKVKKRSRSCDDRLFPDIKYDTNMTTDKRNLEHVTWSRTGQLFIRPFGSGTDQATKATSEVHMNNLQNITTENNIGGGSAVRLTALRSTYYTSFIKFNDKYCVHCSRYPICATKTMSLLRAGGGYIPWPTMTYSSKHYDTFLQRAYTILFGETNLYPDEHLLSGPKVTCSKCKLPYVFLSKADEERHNQWIHAPTQELKRSSTGVNKIVKRKRSLSPEY
ncbi:unnamed protein product [Rotaria magnacalcarata]